jgi:hypothetical protein
MLHQQIQRKQKNFALQRGIYIVRYEKAVDPSQPPMVSIACEAGRNEVILLPDQARPMMSAPGQALVIRAIENGSVQVEIASAGSIASLDATLKFELLRGETSAPATQPPQLPPPPQYGQPGMYVPPSATAPTAVDIQLLGHVARLGDVSVGSDEWLGGPSAPARIEGFLLRWHGRPADVQLRYGATVAGSRPGEARLVEVDEFAGSRGRARAILGLMMELVGPGAHNYNLNVEALFLGSPARRMTGQTVNLNGPSGREPLVGLRVVIGTQVAMPKSMPGPAFSYAQPTPQQAPLYSLQPSLPQPLPQVASQPVAATPALPMEPKRVRVFRA